MPHVSRLRFKDKNYKLITCSGASYFLLFALLIVVFAIELYQFSNIQDVWVDETTQLTGIKLNLFDMLRWLAGSSVAHLGVPDDRMPPLSYLLDWSLLHLLGPSEVGFRLFHSVFVLGGVVGLAAATSYALGPVPTIIFLGFMVLSPKLISTGAEIRAYPIFFAVTCAQVALFLRVVNNPIERSIWPLALFALLSLVAIYTHFFGVVSFGAFAVALATSYLGHRGARRWAAFVFGIICVVGTMGVLPFVLGAAKHSGLMVADHKDGGKLLIYFFKLFADSANMVSPTAAALFFAGILTLFAASTIGFYLRARKHHFESVDWLLPVALVGILLTVMASFFVHSFDALKASYSVWMFPIFGIIIASGWRFPGGYYLWWDIGRNLAASSFLGGAVASTYLFFSHLPEFVHGPRQFVLSLYEKVTAPKAIVYERGAEWGFAYFPLFFTSGGFINQYLAVGDNIKLIESGGAIKQDAGIGAVVAPYRVIFLIDLKLRTSADIRRCNDDLKTCPQFLPSEVDKTLDESRQWTERAIERKFGLYDTRVRILEKVHE